MQDTPGYGPTWVRRILMITSAIDGLWNSPGSPFIWIGSISADTMAICVHGAGCWEQYPCLFQWRRYCI